jgi:hypothetical protein
MKAKNISIVQDENGHIYKKYEVELNGKKDIICYSQDDWGVRFEPYNGDFSEEEFEDIFKFLWDDAYYNINFSKF